MLTPLDKQGESSTSASVCRGQSDSIPLYLIDGVATVWDAQVAATLHVIHSVSGLRAGTLPGVSQQNGFLGLPLTLMQEETALLLRLGVAHLVPVLARPSPPSVEEVARHTAERKQRIKAAEEGLRREEEGRRAVARERFERGGDKAREKREARARAKAEKERAKKAVSGHAAGPEVEEEEGLFGQDEAGPSRPSEEADTATVASEPAGMSTGSPVPSASISTSASAPPKETWTSPGHFHVVPSLPSFPSLAYGPPITSLPHPLFPFPSTPRDCALVDTFVTLHSQGYRMGLGPRFGGEYLVYPGDYLRYHAHFTSQVIVRDEPIKPTELVAWGRLGTGTKKAGLLCCWDDSKRDATETSSNEQKGNVDFYSLEWANFG